MVDELIREILSRPGKENIGMILSHVGIVRGHSRAGQKVSVVRVRVNREALSRILEEARQRPGIFAVEVKINEGELRVGDVLMVLVVAGDFRENVINTLTETLNAIKAQVTSKEEEVEA
ncbi:MAG: molybdenum cofactor biosynthesis protein MoaE [Thermodesulfobacteria bacterium]|nr:molybdenum cofactor biosynthesis protein MoaE [Thermodesulfobacteriota bacterium]